MSDTEFIYDSDKVSISTAVREAQRRRVVWAIRFLFFLFLVEGPLRKWLLPGLAGPLSLLRDPFVFILYIYCLGKGFMWTRGVAQIWLLFAFLTATIGLIQFAANDLGVQGWLLGIRTYWLYMPLALVIASTHLRDDLIGFLRIVLAVSIPYALLVIVQYDAPMNAFVNWGVGGEADVSLALADGVIRPFGLFTYTAPNVLYTAFSLACFLAYYLAVGKDLRQSPFLVAAGLAVATMCVLTGSRTIYFQVAAIIGFSLLVIMISRPTLRSVSQTSFIITFIGFAAILFVNFFPDMFVAMGNRIENASLSEGGWWNRIYYNSFSFLDGTNETTLLGYGIGAGAPGVTSFLGLPSLFLGESDTLRNLNELGLVVGSVFLLLRFATAGWVGLVSLRLARKKKTFVLPLAGLTILSFIFGVLTNSTTEAFLIWITFGLWAAAKRSNAAS